MNAVRRQASAMALTGVAALGGCALTLHESPARLEARAQAQIQAQVQALVQPLVAAHRFSGAIVLMRDGRVLHASGHGMADPARGLAFTPDTPSDGGSLAKNFTAAGLWALAHEGRLSLSQPVQAVVPEYPHAGVTVAHLLAHSGGLAPAYESFDRHFSPGVVRTTSALLALAGRSAAAPAFEPGSRFEYSDLGYDAAALVIERLTAQDYASFVRQRFFVPHGLQHSFARPARLADWPVPRTPGLRFDAGRWMPNDAYDDEAFLGASNLMFSARDLVRWGDAWARGAVLPLAAEAAGRERPMLGGQRSAFNLLGWQCDDAGLRCHNTGELNGYVALVHWDRANRETVALVSNSSLPSADAASLRQTLADLLARQRSSATPSTRNTP